MQNYHTALIELRDLRLQTNIGTYGPNETRPNLHLLDLTLGVAIDLVLIPQDGMTYVFDYDPLIAKIDQLAGQGKYETQERLVTLIATACAAHNEVKTIEIMLKKLPVRADGGSLGIRLFLDEKLTNALRPVV